MFPSPIGELHFSILSNLGSPQNLIKFPSPIGELHFSMKSTSRNGGAQHSFRPLSGSYISQ